MHNVARGVVPGREKARLNVGCDEAVRQSTKYRLPSTHASGYSGKKVKASVISEFMEYLINGRPHSACLSTIKYTVYSSPLPKVLRIPLLSVSITSAPAVPLLHFPRHLASYPLALHPSKFFLSDSPASSLHLP